MNAELRDKPDIQIEGQLGVEVTTADSQYEKQVNSEFNKYCQGVGDQKRRKETIERTGEFFVKPLIDEKYRLVSGGGWNVDIFRENLCRTITNKAENISKYAEEYKGEIELAVLYTELFPAECEKMFETWIREVLKDTKAPFTTVYIVCNRFLLKVDTLKDDSDLFDVIESSRFDENEIYKNPVSAYTSPLNTNPLN